MLLSTAEALGSFLGYFLTLIFVILIIGVVIKALINTSQNTEQIKNELMKNNANSQNEVAVQHSSAPKENQDEKQASITEAKLKNEIQKLQKDKDRLVFLITTISSKLAESSFADKCQGLLKHIDTILEQIEKK